MLLNLSDLKSNKKIKKIMILILCKNYSKIR